MEWVTLMTAAACILCFQEAPFGSMSEQTVIRPSQCVFLPNDLDDVTAAAIAIPGMSSWAALKERAKLTRGETVPVNGATGTAGRLAVEIAKYMGAKKVVATGRNMEALKALAGLGADVTIPLGDGSEAFVDALKEQFGGDGIDVCFGFPLGAKRRTNYNCRRQGRERHGGHPVHTYGLGEPTDYYTAERGSSFFCYHAYGQRYWECFGSRHGAINR
jgi:NADPH:quinone reductase-like Zn-dependent oxidoreductase